MDVASYMRLESIGVGLHCFFSGAIELVDEWQEVYFALYTLGWRIMFDDGNNTLDEDGTVDVPFNYS